MSDSMLVGTDAAVALRELEAAFDRFVTAVLDPSSDDEIENLLRRFETVRNKSAAVPPKFIDPQQKPPEKPTTTAEPPPARGRHAGRNYELTVSELTPPTALIV